MQVHLPRDPRLKPPRPIVVLDSDDEEGPRKAVASADIISIDDSESDSEQDSHIQHGGYMDEDGDEYENDVKGEDLDDLIGEDHDQDYDYEADYLLGGPMEVQPRPFGIKFAIDVSCMAARTTPLHFNS